MSNHPATLEEKIQRLLDLEQIRTLMSKYCHGLDKKDEALFMSIWAADGEYDLPRGHGTGTQGIRELMHKVWKQVPKCHHHISNPLIELNGDRASAKADVIYYRQTEDGARVLLSGFYTFELSRTAEDWLIRTLKFWSFDTASPMFKGSSDPN